MAAALAATAAEVVRNRRRDEAGLQAGAVRGMRESPGYESLADCGAEHHVGRTSPAYRNSPRSVTFFRLLRLTAQPLQLGAKLGYFLLGGQPGLTFSHSQASLFLRQASLF